MSVVIKRTLLVCLNFQDSITFSVAIQKYSSLLVTFFMNYAQITLNTSAVIMG